MANPFSPDTAFVTVQRLPERDAAWIPRVRQLLGLELYTVKMQVRQPTPLVLGVAPAGVAQAAVDVLVAAGGKACAPTWEAMSQLARPEDVSAFTLEPDVLRLDLVAGGYAELQRQDVVLLMLAALKSRTRETRREVASASTLVARFRSRVLDVEEVASSVVGLTREEMLLMVLRQGRVLQVGRRCRFPPSWGPAMDWRSHLKRLAPLVAEWDGSVAVDQGFARFIPPGAIQLRMEQLQPPANRELQVQSNSPALDFYLRWRFCLEVPR